VTLFFGSSIESSDLEVANFGFISNNGVCISSFIIGPISKKSEFLMSDYYLLILGEGEFFFLDDFFTLVSSLIKVGLLKCRFEFDTLRWTLLRYGLPFFSLSSMMPDCHPSCSFSSITLIVVSYFSLLS